MTSEAITLAVEGDSDTGVLQRLLHDVGLHAHTIVGRRGKPYLLDRLPAYNRSAQYSPWVVLLDLDRDYACAPEARRQWLPAPTAGMTLRIACRAMEAWLLADREGVARFLGVAASRVPIAPDLENDPKRLLVDLARRSRRRHVREGLVPRDGSGRSVGPTYVSDINSFALHEWKPSVAADASPSLARAMTRVRELADRSEA